MTRSEVISIVALLISVTSLVFSFYFNFRDRANLKTSSQFFAASEFGPSRVEFTIVNAGRRPIILRMWGGTDEKGEWVGRPFGNDNKWELQLGEHERFDHHIEQQDLYFGADDDLIMMVNLWVEDTLGRRQQIKDAKKNIASLLKS
jgi:hypothetical protein